MSEVKKKPHFFDVVMNSTSELTPEEDPLGVGGIYLNQEVIVREYAFTPQELTAKQMPFSKEVIPAITGAFDTLSAPVQELGVQEMMENFEKLKGNKNKPG